MKSIKLSEEDRLKLAELYHRAQITPVIIIGFGAEDQATLTWNRARKFMDELGKKYNFDPSIYSINTETGEIKKYSEIDFENIKYKSGRRFQLSPESKNE